MLESQLRGMLDAVDDARVSSALNLTIGSLLKKMDGISDDAEFQLTNGAHLNGFWDSYRGYYSDLAFAPAKDGEDHVYTFWALREMLNDALAQGTMTGYKGGEYPITEDTLLWLSPYGTASGDVLVDLLDIQGQWYLIVKNEDE